MLKLTDFILIFNGLIFISQTFPSGSQLSFARFSILKLNGKKYFLSKFRIQLFLVKEGIRDVIFKKKNHRKGEAKDKDDIEPKDIS